MESPNVHHQMAALQEQIEVLSRTAGVGPQTMSEHAAELEKWNKPRRLGGYRCDGHDEYPKGLYRQVRTDEGKKVMDYMTVRSPEHEAQMAREGWVPDQHVAIARFATREDDISQAAAEAAARARTMSRLAREEYERQEDAQSDHVTDVPAPTKRPKLRVE